MSAPSLLDLDAVDVSYRRRGAEPLKAVIDASLQVAAGEIVGLVGESGCGKSTLGRAAVGLLPLAGGRVLFDGEPVESLTHRARRPSLRALQMIFQDPYASLNPRRRVGEQIEDAIMLGADGASGRAGGNKAVIEVLDRVGLSAEVASRFPHEFSGGQCQRIAVARVLATRPTCIVADEPISALDASAQAQVANLLADIARESGLGLLFISHDLSVVRRIATKTVVMYLGRIVESGPTEQVWQHPAHPYTEALIGAIPRPGPNGALPAELPGEVPDPARRPSGCSFHPRCPSVMDRCRTSDPAAVEVGPGWEASCFLASTRVTLSPRPTTSTTTTN
jgi:oligopeptide/dipeptide ABC transporter ATP-binding protein